ncbi:hypothetical protein [Amycolatopsis jiangsuensis]|uniref:Transposase n=1 Tax=Amycolatopsis jiangsuensis TaxID=1181879 RepID=A0A840IWW9_9PSEU|nr:hypothetical protein [Amycolatopsis jiangsuensis]MBB4685925.1 hypothetical protein [Amycolatopsis jiangsuensis]
MTVELLTTRDYEARTGETARVQPKPKQNKTQETTKMLLHEELSRARIREIHTAAETWRPWRHARAARRWSRLARWAETHAERHRIQH